MHTNRRMNARHVAEAHDGVLLSLKKERIVIHVTLWMLLEDIVLSAISHSQKDKHCRFHAYWRCLESSDS